jgi:UDP-glucuronate 4-epimerase
MRILVTGAAGFIGSHVSHRLLQRGDSVFGIDNLNAYYDPQLKRDRLSRLEPNAAFKFEKMDVSDRQAMGALFAGNKFDKVVHLAAQAGVRYSLENPHSYIDANIVGFINVLEGCRHSGADHLVYASSSSVYGANEALPFSVSDNVDHPVSLYAVTKKANELMAHSYSHLFKLPTTGLRFFTVYGPWGRPDMALFLFTKNILEGKPINVFNNGHHMRDFTFVDDITEGVVRTLDQTACPSSSWSGKDPDPATSSAPYRIYNIGNNNPVKLMDFIAAIEKALGVKAQLNMLPIQPGDVEQTYADIEALSEAVGFRPATTIEEGIGKFVAWYRDYYRL